MVWLALVQVAFDPESAETDDANPDSPTLETAQVVPDLSKMSDRAADTVAELQRDDELERDRERLNSARKLLDACEVAVSARNAETLLAGRRQTLEMRLISVRDELDAVVSELARQIERVEKQEANWEQRRRDWGRNGEAFSVLDGEVRKELLPTLRHAQGEIAKTLNAFKPAKRKLINLQEEALLLRSRATHALDRVSREESRSPWERSEEPVWSPTLWQNLEFVSPERSERRYSEFWSRVWRYAGMHGLVFVVVFGLASWLRSATDENDTGPWRPIAIAAFLSSARLWFGYVPMPPLFEAMVWLLIGTSGARVAVLAVDRALPRRVAVGMAVGMPLVLGLEALAVPLPILRVLMVIAAIVGVVGLWRQRNTKKPEVWGRVWVLLVTLGALVGGVIAVTEVGGYVGVSRYLLTASLRSLFSIIELLLFIQVGKRLVEVGRTWVDARIESKPWSSLFSVIAYRVDRGLWIGVFLHLGLEILYAWRVLGPPTTSWQALGEASISIGGYSLALYSLVVAVIVFEVARLVSRALELAFEQVLKRNPSLDRGTRDSLRTLVYYVVLGLGTLIALSFVGIQLQNIALVAGALGIGIGFGLQSIVADFTSGIVLLVERPIRVGDNLVVDGRWGVVRRIGLRSTVVRLIEECELVVPNSHLTDEKLENWTLSARAVRLFVPVGVAYGSPLDKVFETLEQVAVDEPETLDHPKAEVLFMQFGANSLDFELRVWVKAADRRFSVRSRLLREIDRRFRETGIEIAFPQRDLHVRSIDTHALAALSDAVGGTQGVISPTPDLRQEDTRPSADASRVEATKSGGLSDGEPEPSGSSNR